MEKNPVIGVRKGAWTRDEDILLRACIQKYGEGKWHLVPCRAGLNRCRKSCRLRWLNYLRPNLKRGYFNKDEVDLIVRLHKLLGNRWSLIAGRLPGRTANDIKNFWNTHFERKTKGSSSDKIITRSNIIRPRPWTFEDLHQPTKTREPNLENFKNKNPSSTSTDEENPMKKPSCSSDKSFNGCTKSVENLKNKEPSLSSTEKEEEVQVDEYIRWWNNLLQITEKAPDEDPLFMEPRMIDGHDTVNYDAQVWELENFDCS